MGTVGIREAIIRHVTVTDRQLRVPELSLCVQYFAILYPYILFNEFIAYQKTAVGELRHHCCTGVLMLVAAPLLAFELQPYPIDGFGRRKN